ncbi:MAG: cyanophycin synthetase [Chloroflexota bacterium]|nr:cyanophycin synthetase [Chloroflexota bacterium]
MSEIQVKKIKVLTGANIWAYRPVLEILTHIGKYEELPSDKLPGFTERLVEAIPSLWDHRCSEGQPGGFLERLRRGTYMGHIIEHIILELQTLAGLDVGFGRTRGTGHYGEYRIVVDYRDADAAKEATYLAIEVAEKLAEGQPLDFNLAERIGQIRETAEDNMLGPSTQTIVDAARKRGIPWMRLNKAALVQLGHGRFARRIQAAETSFTANIGVEIASDKELTKDLLSKVGVPVPEGEVVDNADDAWRAAQDLGGPVVLKPFDGNQGKAVSVNLTTEEQVRAAFELAQEHSDDVIVERYLSGTDHRMLVVNGKLVAVAQRRPPQVVGDGRSNMRELVVRVNEDPRRGAGHASALTRIKMDAAAELTLGKQGYSWDSVPLAGQVVYLRDNSNLSTGGTAIDVTDVVHPDNAAVAVLAASTIGLDIAGVDVVCESIKRPLQEQNGGIVEVNAAPGLRMHVYPSEGKSRPVGEAIVDMLFPENTPARVPLIAITGTNGKTTVTRMIAHIYSTMRKFVGMTTTDGIYFNGVRRVKGDSAGPRSAESVLQHPLVEVAVLETARGGILRSGLAWDRSTVSVALNVANDHLGMEGIETAEKLARVKRVVIESVSKDGYGVLNAEDPLVVAMAEHCPGKIIFFSLDPAAPALAAHLANSGKAVYTSNDVIVLAEGSEEHLLMRTSDIPATYGGLIPFQVQNVLAAAAATWGAGVAVDSIKLGLRTFQTDEKSAPGRFNLFNIGKARVIIDYGHNPHALRAVQGAIRQMKPRKSIGVVASPGDRRDADIQELAVVAANTFDHIIIREDEDLRGRERGEVAQLMEDTIRRARPTLPITVCVDEREASIQALEMARDGDLVVLFIDHVDEAIALVKSVGRVLSDEHQSSFFRELPRTANTEEYARIQAIADTAAQESVGSPWHGSDGNGTGRGEEVRPKEGVALDGESEQ